MASSEHAQARQSIAVALCTYNGASYLREQLDSLAAQTRLPDELVVCDDASNDSTREILRAFADEAPFPVRIQHNKKNLGVTKNFQQVIELCQGDLIALCDQDDLWRDDKLSLSEAAFIDEPGLGLVFSDGHVVDRNLRTLGYRLSKSFGLAKKEWRELNGGGAFNLLLRRPRVTGATLIFPARHRDVICPIPEEWLHDEWLALILGAFTPIRYIREPLIQYRQHGANQIGAITPGFRAKLLTLKRHLEAYQTNIDIVFYLRDAEKFSQLAKRLRDASVSCTHMRRIEAKTRHVLHRGNMPTSRCNRLLPVFQAVIQGDYAKYSDGWQSIFIDLVREINRDLMHIAVTDLLREKKK